MRTRSRLCAHGGHVAGASQEEGNWTGVGAVHRGDRWMREVENQHTTTSSNNPIDPGKDHDSEDKEER
jgi:hypothetical protein